MWGGRGSAQIQHAIGGRPDRAERVNGLRAAAPTLFFGCGAPVRRIGPTLGCTASTDLDALGVLLLPHLANVGVTGVFLVGQSVRIVAATQSFASLLPVARGGVAAGTQPLRALPARHRHWQQ